MAPHTTVHHQDAARPPVQPDVLTLVRKSVPGEALVTDWSEACATAQQVTARWPISHSFHTEEGRYRPLLFVESLRQALALLTHSVHDIPLSHRLGWEHLWSSVNPEALWTSSQPATVTLMITHPLVRRRRLGSVHLTSHIEAVREGVQVGSADVQYTAHPPALYNRLRGRYADAGEAFARALPPAPAAPAALMGRRNEREVVLSPTGPAREWELRVDVSHQVLFDHPHDHVPGMVLLEAAAQAAQACAGHPVVPVEFDTEFFRYVEFDRPCLVAAEPALPDGAGRARVKVTASQEGRAVFSSTVTTVAQPG
ncbi:ScbA/BarX family gamma-butyrolactone biosynthesis protein [Streptomyces sp. NPDC058655]|uniref:ScbA/BarX family gamma-butyrolactone biosynthesis protein n=1 Tax=Streptomyces sp. NPDC058655 TaxID=3346577 RepID=UPI00364FD859